MFWKAQLLHYITHVGKGKDGSPPPPSRGCYCCWCCRLSIFFASSYCLSAFLNSCLYMEVADRRKRKRRVEWSKQRPKRKCVRGNQNTPASGEHFIFFYYKRFRGPTTLHPRRPHYMYTSNWARIFIYAPLHGWSMLFSERKNQRKRKKKKKEFTCVQTGSGRVKLRDQHFRVGLFVVSFSFIITKEKKI